MTSEEIIRRYYDTFNSGDRAAFLALLDENVEHELNQGVVEISVAAFQKFLHRMDLCYAEQVEDLCVMSDANGNRGAAEFFIRGTYLNTDEGLPPATGQTYHLRVGAFFELRDGKVTRITNYYNLQEWLRQIEN